jgi:hypothetical protein
MIYRCSPVETRWDIAMLLNHQQKSNVAHILRAPVLWAIQSNFIFQNGKSCGETLWKVQTLRTKQHSTHSGRKAYNERWLVLKCLFTNRDYCDRCRKGSNFLRRKILTIISSQVLRLENNLNRANLFTGHMFNGHMYRVYVPGICTGHMYRAFVPDICTGHIYVLFHRCYRFFFSDILKEFVIDKRGMKMFWEWYRSKGNGEISGDELLADVNQKYLKH